MQLLHSIDYHDFTIDELCDYLEERHYKQILSDMEITHYYLTHLSYTEQLDSAELINILFRKLQIELKQLFTKDSILIFPHLKKRSEVYVNLEPINTIHQKINGLLQQIRKLLNNYIQQPHWSSSIKICCNELYSLEQEVQLVLYLKENFLWTKINAASNEYKNEY